MYTEKIHFLPKINKMIIITDQILLYRKIHILLLLNFFVMLYLSFVMNTLKKNS
jgi:hypothetical protein